MSGAIASIACVIASRTNHNALCLSLPIFAPLRIKLTSHSIVPARRRIKYKIESELDSRRIKYKVEFQQQAASPHLHSARLIGRHHDESLNQPRAQPRVQGLEAATGGGIGNKIVETVLADFAELTRRHNDIPVAKFNEDTLYKQLTSEAIEAKSLAIHKIRICAGQVKKGAADDTLARVMGRPLQDFATRAVELEEETGLSSASFPWKEILEMRSAINFGLWRAEGVDPGVIRVVSEELFKNTALRGVTLQGDDRITYTLALPKGWKSSKLEWSEQSVVNLSPAVASILVKHCVALQFLDLR